MTPLGPVRPAALPSPAWTRDDLAPAASVVPLGGGDDRVAIATESGLLCALEPEHGSEAWSADTGQLAGAAASPDGTRLFATGTDGRTWCLSSDDGHALWTSSPLCTRAPAGPPGVAGPDAVLVNAQGGHLVSLDPRTGAPLWERDGDPATAPVPTPDGAVLLSSRQGIEAVDARTGQPRWTWPLPPLDLPAQACAGPDGVVLLQRRTIAGPGFGTRWISTLTALRAQDGSPLWTAPLDDHPAHHEVRVSASRDAVVATTSDGRLLALEPWSGRRTWVQQLDTRPSTLSAPCVGPDQRVYVVAQDGTVHRRAILDGAPASALHAPRASSETAPVVSPGGVLYVSDGDGHLQAFRTPCTVDDVLGSNGRPAETLPPSILVEPGWITVDGVRVPRRPDPSEIRTRGTARP